LWNILLLIHARRFNKKKKIALQWFENNDFIDIIIKQE
jgi:hypothetical protein